MEDAVMLDALWVFCVLFVTAWLAITAEA